MKKVFWIAFLALSLFTSCCSLHTRRTLRSIESYLHDSPDSAWTKLNRIDGGKLPTRSLRARHALLYSLAADKTYHDFKDDSVARVAVDYFDTKGSDRHRMLAWYSLGRVQINAEQWTSAIISLTEADLSAEKCRDRFYRGLIYRNLAMVFRGVHDNNHALIEIDKAIDFFDEKSSKAYRDYSLYDKIRYLYGDRKERLADQLCDSLLASSSVDRRLNSILLLTQARMSSAYGHHTAQEVIDMYRRTRNDRSIRWEALDYSNLAYAFSQTGDADSVKHYESLADSHLSSREDSARVFFNRYKIAKDGNRGSDAIRYFSYSMHYEDSLVHVLLNNSVSYALKEHQGQMLNNEKSRTRNQRLLLFCIVLAALLVLSWIIVLLHRKRKELQDALMMAANLHEDLSVSEKSRSHLQSLVVGQYQDKLLRLKSLSNSYLFWENDHFRKERKKGDFATDGEILDRFRSQLQMLRSDVSLLSRLEEETDTVHDHLISRLRNETSSSLGRGMRMDETDFKLMTLFLSGFDNQHTAFLSGMDYDLVRKRKSRLLKKLEKMGTDTASQLLNQLQRLH